MTKFKVTFYIEAEGGADVFDTLTDYIAKLEWDDVKSFDIEEVSDEPS